MRLFRLAFIPSLACVLSCSGPGEERTSAPFANPVQPVLGNPILFPSVSNGPLVGVPTPTPTPSPSPSPKPSPTPSPSPTPPPTPVPTPTPSPTPGAPTPTPTPSPTPSPTSTPSPTPTPAPNPGNHGIHHIRVGFYGVDCKNGKPEPNNGAGLLPVGCKGFVTATPKYANGDDVPASIHGPNVAWNLESGAGIVAVKNSKTSIWNKDLTGLKAGTFSLCATVLGVRGCLNGTVTP